MGAVSPNMGLLGMRCVVLCAAVVAVVVPATASAAVSSAARSEAAWSDVAGTPAPTRNGASREIKPRRFRALRLDRASLSGVLGAAPRERTAAARNAPLTVSLPAPDGTERRFALEQSSVMAPGLAAKHPQIRTYRGVGIDDPGATVHLDLTPAGLHASVRGPGGSWYIDPYYRGDDSVYASYRRGDLTESPHERFIENDVMTAGARTEPAPASAIGAQVGQRTYRLALVSDPAYASYHAQTGGVTAAKVTLINRVNQIYEDDFAIHMELVENNDVLNLDTASEMTAANGPCGAAPCYTSAQAVSCGAALDQTQIVIGQLIGASNYDVGHIGMGVNGGGGAYLGVVGSSLKGGGCTGVTNPVGDLFAVDYVAHELGHQFAGRHTFNGTVGSCSGGNRNATTAVEPGSGSTIMAYAGICAIDNLQPHSDPYFSQRSIDEVMGYVGAALSPIAEVQTVSLRGFSGTDSFRLTYNGGQSPVITRGTNYTSGDIATAIEAIPGFPPGATVTVRDWVGTSPTLNDTGFSVTFGGTLANADALPLTVTAPAGVTGFVGETDRGGPTRNGGAASTSANRAPEVIVPEGFTIPRRTPFSLTGEATDADGDTLVYLWEQNDAGTATGLTSNTKPDGPLFRVFGRRAVVTSSGTLQSPSPGENVAGTSPTRELPDMAQILAGNTNAASGSCPAAEAPIPATTIDCYSEFLPTSAYAGPLHFRLTARDGGGGVAHDDTTLTLAPGPNPFRVTSQATATSVQAGAPLTITWAIADTNVAPVNTANVKITLSTDGGQTFPTVLSESTPNDGSQSVVLPNANTTTARLKVEAVGNIFFDVNRANFSIVAGAPVATHNAPAGGATAQYSDAIAPVTVSATDSNTQGSSLTATAPGLPAGLTLAVASTSPGTGAPGSRSWTIGGNVTAMPNTYPVDVTVSDGAGHSDVTSFNVVVTAENATVTYTGDTLLSTTTQATLSATVVDSADGAPGNVTNAPVTFKEGTTTLCTASVMAAGTATCTANLTTGTHHVDVFVGGRYTGSAAGDVDVRNAPAPAQPGTTQPGPTQQPATPLTPALGTPLTARQPSLATAALAPNLRNVAARRRLSRTGRVSIKLACRPTGLGLAPSNCIGTLKLTMRIRGKKQTIGTAPFSLSGTARKTVSIKLSTKARRALKKTTSATLTAAVTNTGGSTRTATKSIKLLPRQRP